MPPLLRAGFWRYLVQGSLAGAWDGLDATVDIVNWNSGNAQSSLNFFSQRGHQQIIAAYYDEDAARNLERWRAAAQGVPRHQWVHVHDLENKNYDDLEEFAELVQTPAR